jgi:hypothetical protein
MVVGASPTNAQPAQVAFGGRGRKDAMAEQGMTGIEVKTGFFPLAFFLFFCTPRIEIDGQVHKKSWGTHFFEVSPGTHTITVYFGYFFMSRCGQNSISVNVPAGTVRHVRYNMPPWMFAKGSLKVF